MRALPHLPVTETLPALKSALTKAGAAVLVAPPGAGKTTAMRCMLGLIRKHAGTVAIFGDRDLRRARARVVRQRDAGAVEPPRLAGSASSGPP